MKATTFEEILVKGKPLPVSVAPVPPPFGLLDSGFVVSRTSHRRAPPNVVGPASVTKRVAFCESPVPLLTMAPAPFTPVPCAVIGSALLVIAIQVVLQVLIGCLGFDADWPAAPGSFVASLLLGAAAFAALGLALSAAVKSAVPAKRPRKRLDRVVRRSW